MNTTARLLCLAATSLSTLAFAQSAPPRGSGLVDLRAVRDANAPETAPDRFVLHDVAFFLNGEPMALITDLGRPPGLTMFFDARMGPAGCIIKEITRRHVILVDRRSGREFELKIAGASAEDPTALAQRTREWLNSGKNPMFHGLVEPPYGIYDNWEHLSEGQKEEMAVFYRNYGWRFRAEIIAGTLDFSWERTDAADRLAEAESYRDAFANSLSPEQKQAWQQIQLNPRIYATNGVYTEEQRAAIAKRAPAIDKFHASFTPEQKAAFDRMYSNPVIPPDVRPRDPNFDLHQLLPATPATPGVPARYSKAWINSHANPMLQSRSWPSDIFDQWSSLSTAEKKQVIDCYQKHGWQPLVIETVSGSTGQMSWRNIYEGERIAVLKAKREAFLNLLTPEQRQAWRTGPASQTIYIKDGQPDYARNRNGPQQQKFFDPFWASLDARQKAVFEGMHDFTRADWTQEPPRPE